MVLKCLCSLIPTQMFFVFDVVPHASAESCFEFSWQFFSSQSDDYDQANGKHIPK